MKKLVFNQDLCVRCDLCTIVCPLGVLSFEGDKLNYCKNCAPEEAMCMKSCPNGAIKEKDGVILIGEECNGCALCFCPYGGIVLREGRAVKCDLCSVEGFPLCVSVCPTNALQLIESSPEGLELWDEVNFWIEDVDGEVIESEGDFLVIDGEPFKRYVYVAPKLTEEDKRIANHVKSILSRKNFDRSEIRKSIGKIAKLGPKEEIIEQIVWLDMRCYGPISLLLDRIHFIEDIFIYPNRTILVFHRKHGLLETNLFLSERGFKIFLNAMIRDSGKKEFISRANPSVDLTLKDGSRLKAFYDPIGPCAVLRLSPLRALEFFSIPRLIFLGSMSLEMAAFLWEAIRQRKSILISGAPGSGKTTLLSSLTSFIPKGERIIVVEEDIRELVLPKGRHDVVHLLGESESQYDGEALLLGVLRMRPDRIIVGELRGREARRMFFAANVGVPFMATMHSNERGQAVLDRLSCEPMNVPKELIRHLNILVTMDKERRVVEICELKGGELERCFWYEGGFHFEKPVNEKMVSFLQECIENRVFRKEDFDRAVDSFL